MTTATDKFENDFQEILRPIAERVKQELKIMAEASELRRQEFGEIVPDEEVDYFGGCPVCHGCDGYRNVEKSHCHFCFEHKTVWISGWNLFSSWQEESEEIWMFNRLILSRFRLVESYHAPKNIWTSQESATGDIF